MLFNSDPLYILAALMVPSEPTSIQRSLHFVSTKAMRTMEKSLIVISVHRATSFQLYSRGARDSKKEKSDRKVAEF